MEKKKKKTVWVLIGFLILFSLIEIPTGFFKAKLSLWFSDESLTIQYNVFPEGYGSISVDEGSSLLFDILLSDSRHNPVPYSRIQIELSGFSANIKPAFLITDKNGRATIHIIPKRVSDPAGLEQTELPVSVVLYALKSKPAEWSGKMIMPPVLLVHGFQDTSESMIPIQNFLNEHGYHTYLVDYDTNTDIETMADALGNAIITMKANLKEKGIYVEKVDIIAHSLGGLVSRYYTSRPDFIRTFDVRKMIFINVPHHGTPWAEAGAKLLNSPFVQELYPTSDLYVYTFPNAINRGLNQNIQVANIALENDEVVPLPSSTLHAWNIDTKIYRIGAEPLTLDTIIHSPLTGSTRHRQILFYKPVFEELLQYLTIDLPYPLKRR